MYYSICMICTIYVLYVLYVLRVLHVVYIYIYKNRYEPKKNQFLEALIHDPPKKLSNPYWLVVDLP